MTVSVYKKRKAVLSHVLYRDIFSPACLDLTLGCLGCCDVGFKVGQETQLLEQLWGPNMPVLQCTN